MFGAAAFTFNARGRFQCTNSRDLPVGRTGLQNRSMARTCQGRPARGMYGPIRCDLNYPRSELRLQRKYQADSPLLRQRQPITVRSTCLPHKMTGLQVKLRTASPQKETNDIGYQGLIIEKLCLYFPTHTLLISGILRSSTAN